jgi:sigma-B regulation protein RsbU (phosphoserine phosphatase)
MQDLYNELPCIYFSSSADGFIVEANEALCHYLGYSRNELIGQKLESIFTLSTRIFQQTHFYPLLQLKGLAEELYITLKSKDGKDVPVLINAVQNEKDGQTRYHFAGISVIKRKKFEDEIIAAKKLAEKALKENTTLKAAREELQKQAEELDIQIALANLQNQELKQFNHLATHTLQEPLRKLLFFTSEVLDTEDEKNIRTTAQKIRRAAEDLNAKLKGLQQYVWLTNEKLECEEVELSHQTQFTKKQVEFENPGISIILEAEAIPVFEAYREQMQFLLKELFSNAVKFRKPGNVVNIKIYASTLMLNKFRQLTGKYKYAEFVKLQIQDDGIGFDDKYQEQAFEFFRKLHTTPSFGRGIGLSLCRKIVENHSGSISLESQKNLGTTVNIFLPLKQEKTVS